MQEEYYCPNCGLQHRLVRHDTPETKVMCIQCGHRFAIKDASQQSVQRTADGLGEPEYNESDQSLVLQQQREKRRR